MKGKHLISALLLIVMLASCTGQPPADLPPTATQTPAVQPTAAATATTPPALTPTSTNSPTAPAPDPTATTAPSRTATATPTISITATASHTPAATVSAAAEDPLASARWHQLIGDCAAARKELAALLSGGLSPTGAAEARFRMAQCYRRDGADAEATIVLNDLLAAAGAQDPYRAPATFLLGEALAALSEGTHNGGRWADAEAAYRAYLPLAPELAYLTWQRIGGAARAQAHLPAAVEAYRKALAASPDWSNTVAIRRALADLAMAQGDAREAIAQYDALRGQATTGAWAAEMQYLAGNALAREAAVVAAAVPTITPMPTRPATPAAPAALLEAQKRWQAAVNADVTSQYAHAAIVALLDSGATVDEYSRGLANYHRGNYELAVAAFDRLLTAEPAGRDGAALYYRGLSYLALMQTDRGIADLDQLIARFPQSPLWTDAWLAKARGLSRAGRDAEAIASYRNLAAQKPAAAQAPTALWQAAVLAEDNNKPDAAVAEAYLALARAYPKATEAWRAYQNAGLMYFRLGNFDRAAAIWREMAGNTDLDAFTVPVASFWLGRAQAAQGDRAAAAASWQAAQAAGPDSFYGLRAAAWASGRENLQTGGGGVAPATAAPMGSPAGDEAALSAWLQTWAGPGSLALPESVESDPDWRRGELLLGLGLRSQALANWTRVQQRHVKEPWTLAALARAFTAAGAYRQAIASAETVASLSGRPLAAAPATLQRLAYPFPYEPLIRGEADRRGLDPRLLAAIIRQESHFETGAASSAGAQGLMQVMPGTAQSIAVQLGWKDFQPAQAYWPVTNVALGAYYINQWLTHFNGSVFTALAAYNGGPGNAQIWRTRAPQDDDLMAALININETRLYVQIVWSNYEAYQRLYPQ